MCDGIRSIVGEWCIRILQLIVIPAAGEGSGAVVVMVLRPDKAIAIIVATHVASTGIAHRRWHAPRPRQVRLVDDQVLEREILVMKKRRS